MHPIRVAKCAGLDRHHCTNGHQVLVKDVTYTRMSANTYSAMLEVFMQAFIPDARDALQEVNVLKQDTVAEVEREMQKKEENKSSPGCVIISARPQIDFVIFRLILAHLMGSIQPNPLYRHIRKQHDFGLDKGNIRLFWSAMQTTITCAQARMSSESHLAPHPRL